MSDEQVKKPEPKEPTADTTLAMQDGLLMKWLGLPPKFPYRRP